MAILFPPLEIQTQEEVRILEFTEIGLGVPKDVTDKESTETLFPCTVTWCPTETDAHVAQLSPELTSVGSITILGFSKNYLFPGVYKKITLGVRKIVFEYVR